MSNLRKISEKEQNLVNKPGPCRVYRRGHDFWYLSPTGCSYCGDRSPEAYTYEEMESTDEEMGLHVPESQQVKTPFGEVTVRPKRDS